MSLEEGFTSKFNLELSHKYNNFFVILKFSVQSAKVEGLDGLNYIAMTFNLNMSLITVFLINYYKIHWRLYLLKASP